jgi:hypothetical protein
MFSQYEKYDASQESKVQESDATAIRQPMRTDQSENVELHRQNQIHVWCGPTCAREAPGSELKTDKSNFLAKSASIHEAQGGQV